MAENTEWMMEVPPMQELRFVQDDSDRASLVLRVADSGAEGTDGEDATPGFFLPVTDELTEFLGTLVQPAAESVSADAAPETAQDATQETTTAAEAPDAAEPAVIPVRERVHLRPRDIQDRIRHGETVEQIVAETGMEDRRVRPFAVPIAMERHRIAEMARDAHPVRADGPTDAPLREVLAGAFAARGESLRAAEWSAAMDSSDHWVISVSWTKGNREGASRFVADFRFVPGEDGPATAEPVNSVASDLIDPRFERPVRTVSPVVPSSRGEDDTPATEETRPDTAAVQDPAEDTGPAETDGSDEPTGDSSSGGGADAPVDLFGRRSHPAGGGEDPAKRKKKAVTPHWEDVLLGVRTNPRANGRNKKK
ncbi:septation protein SepH [Corynebacterium sp. AOP12-C2-36]|uniref:septation protein SepH n=1 Tax=Corynebacterium sp. AOP12-C2-36 TaxID=3457723 RepID=UPI0040334F02